MPVLDREEYIEQAYFFHTFRERVLDGVPSQDVLARVGEELLSTTRLPTGRLYPAHRDEGHRPDGAGHGPAGALLHAVPDVRRLQGRGGGRQPVPDGAGAADPRTRGQVTAPRGPTPAGLFVYQFEALSRNRLGYSRGLDAMAADPFYDDDWRDYINTLRSRLGDVDFADLIYVRSAYLRHRATPP